MNVSQSIIKEIFLSKMGSSLERDIIFLFVLTPMGIIGTILMSISFIIFMHKDFRKIALFQYLQVYTFSSLVQAATLIFMFYKAPRYLFDISISMSARIYTSKMLSAYVIALLFFYNDIILILLNLERISHFAENGAKNFKKVNPYLACFILLIICELINLPTFFVYEPSTDQDIQTALSSYKNVLAFKGIYYKTSFGESSLGRALVIFGYVVKGLITLLIDLGSTMASAYYMREFFNKKQRIQQSTPGISASGVSAAPSNNNRQNNAAEKAKVNHMKMILYLSICTVFFHFIVFACDTIIVVSKDRQLLRWVSVVLMLVVAVKQILNFFFYFFFNRKFREFFTTALCKK